MSYSQTDVLKEIVFEMESSIVRLEKSNETICAVLESVVHRPDSSLAACVPSLLLSCRYEQRIVADLREQYDCLFRQVFSGSGKNDHADA